jgi:hypothetical protein
MTIDGNRNQRLAASPIFVLRSRPHAFLLARTAALAESSDRKANSKFCMFG